MVHQLIMLCCEIAVDGQRTVDLVEEACLGIYKTLGKSRRIARRKNRPDLEVIDVLEATEYRPC